VGAGSDHLQLIKFWRSCAPGKGVCGGAKSFGSALITTASAVFASLRTLFSLISCAQDAVFGMTESAVSPELFDCSVNLKQILTLIETLTPAISAALANSRHLRVAKFSTR